MSFRRIPFQFTTSDPVERQRELERRFGLSSSRNMFVDVANPLSTGAVPKDTSISSSSPRLQHRVPIFVEGYDQPLHSSVDSTGPISENKKANVRVIPIEVEGAESRPSSARHRTLSGPAGIANEYNDECISRMNDVSPLKHSMVDLSKPSVTKATTKSRVHNIPIQIEGGHNLKSSKFEKVVKSPKKDSSKFNGCAVTKSKVKSPDKEHKRKPEIAEEQNADIDKQKTRIESSLKKIENVLEELKTYEAGVQEFSGTTKDKQYRYLDEMLTRCMLKVDDIDTMGNDNVRSARKNAVKKIQACIDLLESKANTANEVGITSVFENEVRTSEMQEMNKTSVESCDESQNEVEMTEGQDTEQETNKISVENRNKNTCQNETELQKNDVEMTEDQNVEQDISKNLVENCDKKCRNEVEMTEGESVEVSEDEQKITAEIALSLKDVTNVCEVEITEKNHVELPNEVHEVEVAEIKRALSSKDLNSKVYEVPEVEMTNSTSKQNIDSDENIPVKEETVAEIANVQLIPNTISQEDIEMKDVYSTLDDIKKSIEENAVNCTSNQPGEKTKSDLSTEVNSSNVTEMPLSTEDFVSNGDVEIC